MKINNYRIGVRLAVGFAVILLLLTAMSYIGLSRLGNIDAQTDTLVSELLAKERIASEWLLGTAGNAIRADALAREKDDGHQAYFQKAMDGKSVAISEYQKKLEGMLKGEEEKKLFAEVVARRQVYIEKRKAIMALKAADKDDEAQAKIDTDMMPALNAYVGSIEAVLVHLRKEIDRAHDSIKANYRMGLTFIVVATVVALALGGFLAWYLTVGITHPLSRAVALARQVASGDLTAQVGAQDSKDETGQLLESLRTMQDTLALTITQIRQGTETIAVASSEIAEGNLDLSKRTEEQAGALGQTASSMDQLTHTVRQSADNARQANTKALAAAQVATRGGEVVAEVMRTMSKITDSSHKMIDIISVIDGIAFQTNILALNAAVEAARAGEQGRGFAVVASEVRSLAQRSAVAAKEIKTLIDTSEANIQAGSRLVTETGTTMDEIVQSVRHVTDIMGEITAATEEQSSGIAHVNEAVNQMDVVTQQNAALVEEAAAAADALKDQAAELERIVSVFRLNDQAMGSARPVRPAHKPAGRAPAKAPALAAAREPQLEWES